MCTTQYHPIIMRRFDNDDSREPDRRLTSDAAKAAAKTFEDDIEPWEDER